MLDLSREVDDLTFYKTTP